MMFYKKLPVLFTAYAASALVLFPAFSSGTKDTAPNAAHSQEIENTEEYLAFENNSTAFPGEGGGSGPVHIPEDISIPPEYTKDPASPLLPENALSIKGKLKVSGKNEKAVFSIKGEDKKTYTLIVPEAQKPFVKNLKGKKVLLQGTISEDEKTIFVFTCAELH